MKIGIPGIDNKYTPTSSTLLCEICDEPFVANTRGKPSNRCPIHRAMNRAKINSGSIDKFRLVYAFITSPGNAIVTFKSGHSMVSYGDKIKSGNNIEELITELLNA